MILEVKHISKNVTLQLKKGVEIHFKTKLLHGKEVLIFQI